MRKSKLGKFLKGFLAIGAVAYSALFAVFYFDLDGKFLFYVVEPFLTKHYEKIPRKDVHDQAYDIDKFPKYEYEV